MKILSLGFIKGVLIGFLCGVIFAVLDTGHHMLSTKLMLFAVTGALAGVFCGTPLWKSEALTSNMIKAGVGAAVGILAMLALYYIGDFEVGTRRLSSHYALIAPILGGLYGAFVEYDDRS